MPSVTVKSAIVTTEGGIKSPALIPVHKSEAKTWEKFKPGKQYRASLKSEISTNHFDQLHAVSQMAFDNSPIDYIEILTYDQWRKFVSIQIGWCDMWEVSGDVYRVPYSWQTGGFDSNEEFMERLYNPAMDWYSNALDMDRDAMILKSLGYSTQNNYKG